MVNKKLYSILSIIFSLGIIFSFSVVSAQSDQNQNSNIGTTKGSSSQGSVYPCPEVSLIARSCEPGKVSFIERDSRGCYIGQGCRDIGTPSVSRDGNLSKPSAAQGTVGTEYSSSTTEQGDYNLYSTKSTQLSQIFIPSTISTTKDSKRSDQTGEDVKNYVINPDKDSIVKRDNNYSCSEEGVCTKEVSTFEVSSSNGNYSIIEKNKLFAKDELVSSASLDKVEILGEGSIVLTTEVPVKIESNKIIEVTDDGEKEIIKPSEAKDAVVSYSPKIDSKSISEVNLEKCEDCTNTSDSVYKLDATKKVKLLGFIPMNSTFSYTVNASSKEVVKEQKPWYLKLIPSSTK